MTPQPFSKKTFVMQITEHDLIIIKEWLKREIVSGAEEDEVTDFMVDLFTKIREKETF